MAADILTSLATWSTSEGSNLPSGTTAISTNLDDNLRMIQSVVRYTMASDTIASATTTDLGTKESQYLTVSGTTTITSLGTISAGIAKYVTFSGALLLTHNATSLILPTAANITTVAGDTARFLSLGSGNWKCLSYNRANGLTVLNSPVRLDQVSAATATNTIANGIYAQTWGWTFSTATNGLYLTGNSATAAGHIFTVENTSGTPGSIIRAISLTGTNLSIGQDGFTLSGGTQPAGNSPATCAISGCNALAASATNGSNLNISAGNGGTSGGTGGNVQVSAGTGTNYGSVTLVSGGVSATKSTLTASPLALTAYSTGNFVKDSKFSFVGTTNGSPTITAGGGTGATIRGTNHLFEVTFGTGSPTDVTVTFTSAWASTPIAIASGTQSGQVIHTSASTSTIVIASSTAFSSGTKISVILHGVQ